MKIEGQTAWVTGGASGLGEATAHELARLGAKVAVMDVNLAQAEQVAAVLNERFGAGREVAEQGIHIGDRKGHGLAGGIAESQHQRGTRRGRADPRGDPRGLLARLHYDGPITEVQYWTSTATENAPTKRKEAREVRSMELGVMTPSRAL